MKQEERLTSKKAMATDYTIDPYLSLNPNGEFYNAIQKLARYEDLGAVEELSAMKAENERLVAVGNDLLSGKNPAMMTSPIGDLPINSDGLRKAVDEIARLTERLKNAVELPCNIGDTVYGLPYRSYHKGAVEWKVYAIELRQTEDGSRHIKVYVESNGDIDEFWANSIGETIFLTKESAEALLKKLEAQK